MITGLIEYFGAHDRWYAQFPTGIADKFGNQIAHGSGPSPDWATLEALKIAEDSHGWRGAVRFEVRNG